MRIKTMVRRVIFLVLIVSLSIILLGVSIRGAAQGDPTCSSALMLTYRDNGKTFIVPLEKLIILQIMYPPNAQLIYDPTILRQMPSDPQSWCDMVRPPGSPEPPYDNWFQYAARLLAIRSGRTTLTIHVEPCREVICSQWASFDFSVTIVVGWPPTATPYRIEKYIGTAYLNQTVTVQVGHVVVLDLPFITPGRLVGLLYEPAIFELLPGQSIAQMPPNGWHLLVMKPGKADLIVVESICGKEMPCGSAQLYRVTIAAVP